MNDCSSYKIGNCELYHGDCLNIMDFLIEKGIKVDAIITDPPFEITACKFDKAIPFNKHIVIPKRKKEIYLYMDEWVLKEAFRTGKSVLACKEEFTNKCKDGMWDKIKKLRKINAVIALFGSSPYSCFLRLSNLNEFKYELIWDKILKTGHLNSKIRPMSKHENISIFYAEKATYNPIFEKGSPLHGEGIKRKSSSINSLNYGKQNRGYSDRKGSTLKYPSSIIPIQKLHPSKCIHPNQKPIEIMEYLIKTYTNENDLVLDFTAGYFTTCIACLNTGRRCIAIEKEQHFFNLGKERIIKHITKI